MSAQLVLGAGQAGSLTLSIIDRYNCRAAIAAPGLDASGRFHERYGGTPLGLADYFSALAPDWRGWDGARDWEGIGLELQATHDGLGHVALWVTLTQPPADAEQWIVRAHVLLEAGQLDRLAREATVFESGFST